MQDEIDGYLCGLEAQELLGPASDYLLRMVAEQRIDLNKTIFLSGQTAEEPLRCTTAGKAHLSSIAE